MIAKDRLLIQQQIYNFLRTVSIKYDPIAQYLNNTLAQNGYNVNDSDPTSWKYYLNLQGKYHTSDTPMYVMSLDSQEKILFSIDTLVDNPRTKSVYVPGGLYYNRLCETYPEQVDLIKSILFPVTDVEKAIVSDDLTLLGYGSGYLEEYEEQKIIMEIENFLEILKERWYFDFLDDEPYFYITFWGSLWTYLAMLIMTARESYIRTPYVHSWHLWNDLKSQGLDDYSDVLNRKKSMFLYQNMPYLKANSGKQSNLIILANRLLADVGVSIYGRRVVQEAETNAGEYQLIPQLQAVRVPIDNSTIDTEVASETVATVQKLVYAKGLALENTAEAAAAKERRLGDTTLNYFMTKFLEIRPITKSKIYSGILDVFMLETLITSATKGYYNQPVQMIDSSTSISLHLYPRELLALFHYATMKSLGITPTEIPNQVFLYKSFLTEIGTPTKTIKMGEETIYLSSQVDITDYFTGLSYTQNLTDPAAFSEMLSNLWLKFMEHYLMDQDTKLERKTYILQYLSSLCHTKRYETVDLTPGFTDYETWLGINGIDIQSTSLAQYDIQPDPQTAWGNLADSIIASLIPITDVLDYFGNFTLSDFGYSRLRQLFVQMCSYKVVFLESTREIPDYDIGAKWSTLYGPDHFDSEGERIFSVYGRPKDTIAHHTVMKFHKGFTEHLENNTSSDVTYTVKTETQIKSSSSIQPGEMVNFGISSLGDSSMTGTITLYHTQMNPTGISDQ